MSDNIDRLTTQIKLLQGELEAEFAIRRAKLRYTLQGKRAVFEEEILRAHRELRVGLARYVFNANLMTVVTAPVIYAMIVPFVILDITITLYQWICFPVYGLDDFIHGRDVRQDRRSFFGRNGYRDNCARSDA